MTSKPSQVDDIAYLVMAILKLVGAERLTISPPNIEAYTMLRQTVSVSDFQLIDKF